MTKFKHNLQKLLNETPEAYYWIGFIMADGYIDHINNRIKLQLNDKEQVNKFRKFIGYPHVVKNKYNSYIKGKQYKGHNYYVYISDTILVPEIIEKFDFKPRKTYNPPEINITNDNLFTSFLIGFIDGDGNIKKQSGKRYDCRIRIKCHSSWKDLLTSFVRRIYTIFNIEHYNAVIQQPPKAKINKNGYAEIAIANSMVLCSLRNFCRLHSLPIITRKWDVIPSKPSTRYKDGKTKRDIVVALLNQKKSGVEICNIVGLSPSRVSEIKKLERKKTEDALLL